MLLVCWLFTYCKSEWWYHLHCGGGGRVCNFVDCTRFIHILEDSLVDRIPPQLRWA